MANKLTSPDPIKFQSIKNFMDRNTNLHISEAAVKMAKLWVEDQLAELTRKADKMAIHGHRSTIKQEDVIIAFQMMGVDITKLGVNLDTNTN